ncbi:MAG: hypothetical protein L0323_23645 [Planctomycetes bacterium]|nr:hypothetical protein [Planctomycetota bacterium]
MFENSLRHRGVVFAYLFGPTKDLDRQTGMKLHDAVCKELGYEDLSFRFEKASQETGQRGFRVALERREGRGGLTILLEGRGLQEPLRFLVNQEWPASLEHAEQHVDMASNALWQALGDQWAVVHAEVRMLAQCNSGLPSATDLFRHHWTRPREGALEAIPGRLSFAGLRLEFAPPAEPREVKDAAARSVSLEVLREDPKDLYVEVVSQWSLLRPVAEVPGLVVAPSSSELRTTRPSELVSDSMRFLSERVLNLFPEAKKPT